MTILELKLSTAIKEAGDIEDVRLSKEDAAYILGLLKEQEPLPAEMEGGGSTWWMVCGDCHGSIDTNDHYCKHCGRKVKWS